MFFGFLIIIVCFCLRLLLIFNICILQNKSSFYFQLFCNSELQCIPSVGKLDLTFEAPEVDLNLICSTKCEFLAYLAWIRGQAYRSQTLKWFSIRQLLLGYIDLLWVCIKESNCSFSRFTFLLAESHRMGQANGNSFTPWQTSQSQPAPKEYSGEGWKTGVLRGRYGRNHQCQDEKDLPVRTVFDFFCHSAVSLLPVVFPLRWLPRWNLRKCVTEDHLAG